MRHGSVRVWWRPWRLRCACGCRWYPCPDAVPVAPPPVARSLGLNERPTPTRPPGPNERPSWDGPTVRNAGPLMTRGQRWRSR